MNGSPTEISTFVWVRLWQQSWPGQVEYVHQKQASRWKKTAWVHMDDGESVVARVVDVGKDFRDGFVHTVEFKGKRGTFTRDVMCLDQDDDGRRAPAAATIWSAATSSGAAQSSARPRSRTTPGKVTGYEDQVKILSGGKRLAGALNKKHKKHSLDKRDIEIEREGTGWDTDYFGRVVDESDVPLTKDEIKMIDESEIDLERYAYIRTSMTSLSCRTRMAPMTTMTTTVALAACGVDRRSGAREGRSTRASRNGDNDDDDDDDDDGPPRRRSSRKVKPRGGLADIKARKAMASLPIPTSPPSGVGVPADAKPTRSPRKENDNSAVKHLRSEGERRPQARRGDRGSERPRDGPTPCLTRCRVCDSASSSSSILTT